MSVLWPELVRIGTGLALAGAGGLGGLLLVLLGAWLIAGWTGVGAVLGWLSWMGRQAYDRAVGRAGESTPHRRGRKR